MLRQPPAASRLIAEFSHAAQNWPHERRLITRLQSGEQGNYPRFIVKNPGGGAELAAAQSDTLRIRLYFALNGPSAAVFVQATRALGGTQQIHPVPGQRVDSNPARNPSRGKGHHARTAAIPPC